MEKIAAVLWKPEGVSDADFGKRLREAAPALQQAGARQLRVNVVDEFVADAGSTRVGQMDPPKAAFLTFWLDEADAVRGDLQTQLEALASRLALYLVVESNPLHNTTQRAPLGERTPGFNLVTCIEPRDGLDYQTFLDRWHHEHRAVALETQSTFAYTRNEVVRALTPDAPAWAAVVEESFPLDALRDPHVWYATGGDEALLGERRRRMVESVAAFLALERVESHPMSETVFG